MSRSQNIEQTGAQVTVIRIHAGSGHWSRRRGFSLLDVLVSMAVIALLVTIMLPTLAGMHETARRVNCASNIRQMGIGIAFYSGDFNDGIPQSVFLQRQRRDLSKMTTLRLASDGGPRRGPRGGSGLTVGDWDGLGVLYGLDYLSMPKIFYCPSHRGNHAFERYADEFGLHDRPAPAPRVVGNYHYRGEGPGGQRHFSKIIPSHTSIIADGLESLSDVNHEKGANLLRADHAVTWFNDRTGALLAALARIEQGQEFGSAPEVDPWEIIDEGSGNQIRY